ncbi:xylulokinase [Ruania albidiflava]|uniref:xylulokinase n=1 Tax=Ruania albidiflava TaxID=366586 RepID=UPI0023F1B01F|nr:FGGY family carbohydrate kinase [Ruania albidiflava]
MPSSPLVIAVDSSTTSTKAIIVDAAGRVLAQHRCELAMHTPQVHCYEQDPRDWWHSTDRAIAGAVAALSSADRARVSHLCATVQRQSFALVTDAGEPLRPGILWLDGRAEEQVRRLGTEEIHALSGFQPDVTPSLYKLAWLADHEPETLHRADKVVGVHGYLVHELTGRWTDSVATADSLGLMDMAANTYSDHLVALAGLQASQLAELVPAGSVIDTVRPEITQAWGLPGPVELVAACGDGQAAALGVGAIEIDEAYLNLGTALVAGVHSPQYRYADAFRTDAAGIPGQYVLEIVQNSGAYLAGWFRTELGDPRLAGRPDPQLEEAAAQVTPGCGGLVTLPYWNAVQSPHWDPTALGAVVGLAGAYGRPEMYRSVLEGLSIEMSANLASLQAATGVPLRSIRVVGGGQRSVLWRQIMTDAVGLPLTDSPQEEVSAMGAAVLAMAAAGAHPSIAAAARAMADLGTSSEPDPTTHELYRELGEIQAGLYPALRETFARQRRFAADHPMR